MDWKSTLQDAIEQYTTVNGFAPQAALVPESAFFSIFSEEERRHDTWLDGVRVYYTFNKGPEIFLYQNKETARGSEFRNFPFTPIQTSVSGQEQAPDELQF